MLPGRIFLTLSRHPSLSSIAFGRSSGLHPVSAQSCCMYVRVGCPAFARPCEEVHRSISLTSSSPLLQQCPACLVRLTFIVFVTGGRWPYKCCFVGCCLQDLFDITRSILSLSLSLSVSVYIFGYSYIYIYIFGYSYIYIYLSYIYIYIYILPEVKTPSYWVLKRFEMCAFQISCDSTVLVVYMVLFNIYIYIYIYIYIIVKPY